MTDDQAQPEPTVGGVAFIIPPGGGPVVVVEALELFDADAFHEDAQGFVLAPEIRKLIDTPDSPAT